MKYANRLNHRRAGDNPDKGLMNGSCNRTACQAPLNGRPQFSMPNYSTGGRLYYCGECAWDFTAWDRRIGAPLRCSPVVAIPEPGELPGLWPSHSDEALVKVLMAESVTLR